MAASALLLARTDAVAVIVAAVWAFRDGFTFWVRAPFRQAGAGLDERPDEQALHIGVQFADGRKEQTFHEGQVLLQPRAAWHRGRNDGETPLRFLAVFLGAKGVPTILRPPATD